MNKQIITLMILLVLALPLVMAETETYKINQATDLKFTCTLNNAIPSGSTTYNITLSYPNSSTFLNNVATTSKGNGAFNYTTTFTELGLYKVQMFCTDGTYSYSNEGYYDITGNGKEQPEGSVIVLFSLIFLVIVGFLLYSLILSLGHFASLDLDVIDLAKSMGIYFVLVAFYYLNGFYMGNVAIDSLLLILIRVGGFTHIFIPLIGFLISITIGSLKKKKIDFGVNRIYRRQRVGR